MTLDINPTTDKYIVRSLEALIEEVKYRYLYSADLAFSEGEYDTFNKCTKMCKLIEEEPKKLHWVLEDNELYLYFEEDCIVSYPTVFYEFYCSLEHIEKRRCCAS